MTEFMGPRTMPNDECIELLRYILKAASEESLVNAHEEENLLKFIRGVEIVFD